MQTCSVAADLHSQIVWHDEQSDIQIIVVLCYQNLFFRYLFPECFLVAFCIDNIEFLVVGYSSILNCFRRDSFYTWAALTIAVVCAYSWFAISKVRPLALTSFLFLSVLFTVRYVCETGFVTAMWGVYVGHVCVACILASYVRLVCVRRFNNAQDELCTESTSKIGCASYNSF